MKIYEFNQAVNPRRVRIFLAEKSVDVPYSEINIRSGENLSGPLSEKNPTTKVPFLELDDGNFIGETTAICRYFEELYPQPALLGSNPLEKAQIEMWQRIAELSLLQKLIMGFQHTTGIYKDRMIPVPEFGEISIEEAKSSLDIFEEQLEKYAYLAGDHYSIADITLLCALDFAKLRLDIEIGNEYPSIKRWYQLVCDRPSTKA